MVHGLAIKHGINGSLYVEHTLMDMYATCKDSMDAAWLVFETIQVKNSVSWSTMSVGYMNRGDGYAVVRMLRRMLQQVYVKRRLRFRLLWIVVSTFSMQKPRSLALKTSSYLANSALLAFIYRGNDLTSTIRRGDSPRGGMGKEAMKTLEHALGNHVKARPMDGPWYRPPRASGTRTDRALASTHGA
ncbi:hypothetical protein Syun_021101 [Stephania yunnanensis]|uniref:Pentatricopeptide repeat-containing protein n=1 Tax=Stephania yunnanensis TaxID=152371 RepID=A0AAP0IF30_9MAGN